MSAPLPSGFKSRKEYNDYMSEYNRKYREKKKAELEQKDQLFEDLQNTLKTLIARAEAAETETAKYRNLSVEAAGLYYDLHLLIRELPDSETKTKLLKPQIVSKELVDILNLYEYTNKKLKEKKQV